MTKIKILNLTIIFSILLGISLTGYAKSERSLENVKIISHIKGEYEHIDVDGTNIYVSNIFKVKVLDLSKPLRPILKGISKSLGGKINSLAFDNNKLYVAVSSKGLKVLDVSKPNEIKIIGSYYVTKKMHTRDIKISGKYAYILDKILGVYVLDISNPKSPKKMGSIKVKGFASSLAIKDNYVYVTAGKLGGINIIDVSNPNKLKLAKVFKPEGKNRSPNHIFIKNDIAYVSLNKGGIATFEINKNELKESKSFVLKGEKVTRSIANEKNIFLGLKKNVLNILSVGAKLEKSGSFYERRAKSYLGLNKNNIYLSTGKQGLFVLEYTGK